MTEIQLWSAFGIFLSVFIAYIAIINHFVKETPIDTPPTIEHKLLANSLTAFVSDPERDHIALMCLYNKILLAMASILGRPPTLEDYSVTFDIKRRES